MKISAESKVIDGLQKRFFIVPDYQREYVWQEKHVSEFLDDIESEFRAQQGKKDPSSYFIGSFIAVERNGTYEIIDGQQRLTTIMLALCSIRDFLQKAFTVEEMKGEPGDLTNAVRNLLYEYSIPEKRKKPRVTLQYDDAKDFITRLIAEKPYTGERTKSIERMQDAYYSISDFLGKLEKDSILPFVRYFLTNVEMVFIIPESISSALKTFETVNHRGVGLTPMDLLKNLIFQSVNQPEFATIKEKWAILTKNLANCGEGDKPLRFLRYYLTASYYNENDILREDMIYDWITDKGKKATGYEQHPIEFVDELVKNSAKYAEYVNATVSSSEHAKYPSLTRIGHIGKSNFRQHLILMLSLDDGLKDADKEFFASQLEVLVFYYIICKENPRDTERKFSDWAKELRDCKTKTELGSFTGTKIGSEVKRLGTRLGQAFQEMAESDIRPLYRTKYILGRIDETIRKESLLPGQGLKYYQGMELEHILPQTPDGGKVPTEFKDLEGYDEFVRKVGNLTLAEEPINRACQAMNKVTGKEWFEDKKKEYAKSEILATKSIAELKTIGKATAMNKFAQQNLKTYDVWDMSSINDRRDRLYKLSLMAWKLKE